MTNCNFSGNTATGYGGAVNMGSGTVSNCNFTGNKATGDYSCGGAVYFSSTGNVTNCNFTCNSAGYYGGAVYFLDEGTVKNCNFTNNQATGDGGAIWMYYGSVENCNFTNNTATRYGGAVYFVNTGTVTNCNFTNNSATEWGGAIMFANTGTVTNCNFTDNTATRYGGAVYFVNTGTVTNCNFTDNEAYYGGAIRFSGEGTVSNCNFSGNTATGYGGAVNMGSGTVSNCNFTNNTARYGGAIEFDGTGTVTNCNFTNNKATGYGGAVYFNSNGNVTNCNFADSSASRGGAIFSQQWYTATDTCIFKRNSGENVNVIIYPPTLNVDNFTAVYGSGDKLTFDLKTNSSIPVTNGNISISVYFKNNNSWVDNYSCLSGEGWIPDLPVGSYYAIFDTEYAEFQPINRTITIKIPKVQYYINVTSLTTNNKTVNITAKSDIPKDMLWDGKLLFIVLDGTADGMVIDANYASNGTWWAEHTFNNYGDYQVNATYVGLDNVTITNATISITKIPTNINVLNDTLVLEILDEVATGASLTPADAGNVTYTVSNSSVVKVENGKIIAIGEGTANITVSFVGSDDYAATENKTITVTVSLKDASVSVNNATLNLLIDDEFIVVVTTNPKGLDVTFTPDNSGVVSVDENGVVTALKEGTAIIKVSVGGDGVYALNTTDVTVTVSKIPTKITVLNDTLVLEVLDEVADVASLTPAGAGNLTYLSNTPSVVEVIDGKLVAVGEGYTLVDVSYDGDDKYKAATTQIIAITVKLKNASVNVNNKTLDLIIKDTFNLVATTVPEGLNVSYASTNESVVTVDSKGIVTAIGAGTATIVATVGDDKIYALNSTNVTVTVNKQPTSITAADVSTTYNINKDLVITLKDSNGKALSGVKVTVDLNGAKTYTTDKNGQVKVATKSLAPKTYTAKITFNGNTNYEKSAKEVKVTVKKATPKLTAKKKTYKTTTKTKKYTIILKDNTGKAIKKAKVTLKIKGKTYKATTNSKGKATFKIKKLNKKGTFKATITYKGNKYYKKVTKKSKIKVIITFKTVSRGSKDKATVKEIQQALKDNGYYLSYKGHYLKVDGKFSSCTVRSVKEFQHDKGLKVTGKVDEKTAKKLGILK